MHKAGNTKRHSAATNWGSAKRSLDQLTAEDRRKPLRQHGKRLQPDMSGVAPHLSVCLRSLSRRRAPVAPLSRCSCRLGPFA